MSDSVVRRIGDLRLSAPRTLEELEGDTVVRSFELSEWSAGVATGRRSGLGAIALLATALVTAAGAARG